MNRKIAIIVLYITFFICYSHMLDKHSAHLTSFLYFILGAFALFFYNRKKKIFLSLLNYFFTFYEFMILLLVSNRDWMYDFLDHNYHSKKVFVFLIFSAPTILYIADKIFQKANCKINKKRQ